MDDLIKEYDCTDSSKVVDHGVSPFTGSPRWSSEIPSNNETPSMVPFRTELSQTNCANMSLDLGCGAVTNTLSSLLGNGSSASRRYLPNEHHRIVANNCIGSDGNAILCSEARHELNTPRLIPMANRHLNGSFFLKSDAGMSQKQYAGFKSSNILQNNIGERKSIMSQIPSQGSANGVVQPIDGAANHVGFMHSDIYGDKYLVPDNTYSTEMSIKCEPSFGYGGASINMSSSHNYTNSMDSKGGYSSLSHHIEQISTGVTKCLGQMPLMDSHTPFPDQGHLSQSRQPKRELEQPFSSYQQFNELQVQPLFTKNGIPSLSQSEYISFGSSQVKSYPVANHMLVEPHSVTDTIQHPQIILEGSMSDGSVVSSNDAGVCQSGETGEAQSIYDFLYVYQQVMKCSRLEAECKHSDCMKMKPILRHISDCRDDIHCLQKCINFKRLLRHFNGCVKTECKVCGPVKMRSGFFSQGGFCSDIHSSKTATPSINRIDCSQSSLKRRKRESSSPSHSGRSESSPFSSLDTDLLQASSRGLQYVRQDVRTSQNAGIENMIIDSNHSASSSKESHTEVKVENVDVAGRLPFGIENVNSKEVVSQCIQGRKEPMNDRELKMESISLISTSQSTKAESTKLDARRSASSSEHSPAELEVVESHMKVEVEGSEVAIKSDIGIDHGISEGFVSQDIQGRNHATNEDSEPNMEVIPKSPTSSAANAMGTVLGKPKMKDLSLIYSFTPDKVREHIKSLLGCDEQNTMVERDRDVECQKNTNRCSLCQMEKLLFEPPPRYCGSCSKHINPKGVYYSIKGTSTTFDGGDAQKSFCSKCYTVSGESIKASNEDVLKANLEKRWDYAETDAETEWWVQCDKCQAWQHQICALFNGKRNEAVQAEYTCPNCFLRDIESGVHKPLPHSTALAANNLPTTVLSDYLEQWLFRRLNEEREERAKTLQKNVHEVPGAEGLVIRVVSSVDKKVEVKPLFRELFQKEKYPAEFPYKSKAILLFQKMEGADVCLFGMYVQEYGSECALPNQRHVYISYIDSVKYFKPEIKTLSGEALRTFVYHEILIGYLDYCKKRGFTSCYIWSCPSLKQDDYILYCHPRTQKLPKGDKLRDWYQTMIRKATKQKIVVERTNLYDCFFEPTSDCKERTAARLPYFDSDFWPGEAEKFLNIQDGSGPQKKGGKAAIDRVLRAAKRDALTGNPKDFLLMHQLGDIIRPIKENFIIIHLQHNCKHCGEPIVSGNRWVCSGRKNFHLCDKCHHTDHDLEKKGINGINVRERYSYQKVEMGNILPDTNDNDEIVESEYFDTRMVFLSLCQNNHYQFDTLRRAKHSTMMILHHLLNPAASDFISSCSVCHNDIDTTEWRYCKICPSYNLCDSCYRMDGAVQHCHELVSHARRADRDLLTYRQQKGNFETLLDVLVHASKCLVRGCKYQFCTKVKGFFLHGTACRIRANGGCLKCKKMWKILGAHARTCRELECKVPRCRDVKDYLGIM